MDEFKMPTLGADMTAGTLIQWMKKVGDTVERGDIIAEVDTDKGIIEVEVFSDGVIKEFLIEEGAEVPVGTTLALINGKADSAAPAIEPVLSAPDSSEPRRLRVSPSARKLAGKLRVDLSTIAGSGSGGRIQRKDVERAAESNGSAKVKAVVTEPVATKQDDSRMRKAIAAAMTRSKREIPHYYLGTSTNMDRALDWLAAKNAKVPVRDRVLYSALLVKAVALALRKMPEFNCAWEDEGPRQLDDINIGMAISIRGTGLAAPAILNADQMDLDQIMKNLTDLVKRTRAGRLRSSELSGGTITVTNLGDQSAHTVFGVIYPPQVALVGFGRLYETVDVKNGAISACKKINMSLSADHRVTDGDRGAKFLAEIERYLKEPELL